MIKDVLKRIPQYIVGTIVSLPVIRHAARFVARKLRLSEKLTQRIPVMGTFHYVSGGTTIQYRSSFYDGVGRILFWQGPERYEPETAQVFDRLLRRSSTFFDIGANVGFFTLFAHTVNPDIAIHSFEPVPSIFSTLQYHVRMNAGDKKIRCNQIAVGETNGDVVFHIPHFTMAGARFGVNGSSLAGAETLVRSSTLDSYCAASNVPSVDVIKIDVEGFEPSVLRGATETIQRFRPMIILECLPDCDARFLEQYFSDRNYVYYHLTSNGPIQKTSIIPDRTLEFQNYLFAPQEKSELLL